MADVSVVKLKVRRGTDVQRKLITLDQGELGYTTDSQRLFVGDGITAGGNSAGIKFIADSISNPVGLLPTVQIGDIVLNNDTSLYYVLTGSPYTALSSYKPFQQTTIVQFGSLSASTIGSITPVLSTNYSPLTAQGASQLSVYETLFNAYAGLSASTDLILTNDTNAAYIDMGINSSLYNGNAYTPTFNIAKNNDSYLYSVSGNLVVGTTTPAIGDLVLFSGGSLSGTVTSGGNEIMRLTNATGPYTGFVGINTPTPNQQLTVVGGISSNAVVYVSGGNSNAWNTVYSVVCAASGAWNVSSNNVAVITAVQSNSGRWTTGYTGYTNLTAATATVFLTNSVSAAGNGTFGNLTANGNIATVAIPLNAGSGNALINGNSLYTQAISSSYGYDLALSTNLTNRLTYFGGTQYGYAIQATEASSSRAMTLGINPYGGNVGIGTTNPNATLTVNGAVSASGVFYTGGGGGYYYGDSSNLAIRPPAQSAPNGATFFQNNNGSNTTLYVDSNTNNRVGINTVSPNQALTVVGNISATGNFFGGTSVNTQTGTTYTIVPTDNGTMIASTDNTTGLSAIPSSSYTYPTGFQVGVIQLGTGRTTLSAVGSPTINQANGYYKTTKQYSTATLMYFGGSTGWVLFGDVAT